jgi:hypothetical protein
VAINVSISRREPNPFCANNLCSLKVPGADALEVISACAVELRKTGSFFFAGLIGLFIFINV